MRRFAPALVIGLMVIQSCKRQELPKPFDPEPVFFIEAVIGNQDVKIAAGKDDYYQFSSFSNASDTWPGSFYGELKKTKCDGCGYGIKVTFFDNSIRSSPLEQDVLGVLNPGERTLSFERVSGGSSLAGTQLFLNAVGKPPGNGLSYKWIFSDGQVSYSPSASRIVGKSGDETVLLIASSPGFPDDSLKNDITFSTPSQPCLTSFQYIRLGGNNFRLIAPAGYSNYSWEIGSSNYTGRITDVNLSAFTVAEVKLSVSSTSCSSNFTRKIPVNSNFNGVVADMVGSTRAKTLSIDSLTIPLGQAEITLTDSTGKRYSSTRSTNHPSSYSFKILNSAVYDINESNRKTVKLSLQFEGYLFREDSPKDSLFLKTSKWVTAVAF
jgi:hypothetical protein